MHQERWSNDSCMHHTEMENSTPTTQQDPLDGTDAVPMDTHQQQSSLPDWSLLGVVAVGGNKPLVKQHGSMQLPLSAENSSLHAGTAAPQHSSATVASAYKRQFGLGTVLTPTHFYTGDRVVWAIHKVRYTEIFAFSRCKQVVEAHVEVLLQHS